MKINKIKNVEDFFNMVDKCDGVVELVSKDGDRINLKSKLSQYVSLAKIFSGGDIINELELVCHEASDVARMMNYMMTQ